MGLLPSLLCLSLAERQRCAEMCRDEKFGCHISSLAAGRDEETEQQKRATMAH